MFIHSSHANHRLTAVLDMLAALPKVRTAREVHEQAEALARFEGPARKRWAEACGHPYATSDATWTMLISRARARTPMTVEAVVADVMGPVSA